MHAEQLHAGLVAQDGTARHGAGRVHGQHRHAVTLTDEVKAQRFDEGGLAHARHPADAQAERLTGVRQHGREQLVGQRTVVGAGRFQQRDGFGHGAALPGSVALQEALEQFMRCHAAVTG